MRRTPTTYHTLTFEPAGNLQGEVGVQYTTIDDRRARHYSAVATLTFKLKPGAEWSPQSDLAIEALAQRFFTLGEASNLGHLSEHNRGERGSICSVRIEFMADKPSQVRKEASILGWSQGFVDTFAAEIAECQRKGAEEQERERAEYHERQRLSKANREAAYILNEFGSRCRERAAKITRYAQRLAALKAEMKAEIKVQAKALAEEIDADPAATFGETPQFQPEAIAVARELLAEGNVPIRLPGGGGIPFAEPTRLTEEQAERFGLPYC